MIHIGTLINEFKKKYYIRADKMKEYIVLTMILMQQSMAHISHSICSKLLIKKFIVLSLNVIKYKMSTFKYVLQIMWLMFNLVSLLEYAPSSCPAKWLARPATDLLKRTVWPPEVCHSNDHDLEPIKIDRNPTEALSTYQNVVKGEDANQIPGTVHV